MLEGEYNLWVFKRIEIIHCYFVQARIEGSDMTLQMGRLAWVSAAHNNLSIAKFSCDNTRVKSGIFGQTAKFGRPPYLFHSSVIGIKTKSTKQTVKILMRRLIRSRLIWISSVFKCVSEFTWCPNLPDFTLIGLPKAGKFCLNNPFLHEFSC